MPINQEKHVAPGNGESFLFGILLAQVQGERVTRGVKNFFPGNSKVTFIELFCEWGHLSNSRGHC